jgi:TonB family protein
MPYRYSQEVFAENFVFAGPQNRIPEAKLPVTPVELQWWQRVRAAGKEFSAATERKEKALLDALNNSLRKFPGELISEDERELLPPKKLTELNDAIKSTREKFSGLLREGAEKSYRVPIADRRPLIMQSAMPRYTPEARRWKIKGVILASAQFLADGTIGEVEIKRGLGYGLVESAVDAIYRLPFLPAIKDGRFVEFSQTIQVEFNIR